MTPIAEIVGGTLRWHIPRDDYAVPVEYLRGAHMLYDAAALQGQADMIIINQWRAENTGPHADATHLGEEYDPLTEHECERCGTSMTFTELEPTAYCHNCAQILVVEHAAALQAKVAEIAELKTANKQIFEQARLMYAECVSLRAWKASRMLHEGCNGHMRGDPPAYVPECVSLRAENEALRGRWSDVHV